MDIDKINLRPFTGPYIPGMGKLERVEKAFHNHLKKLEAAGSSQDLLNLCITSKGELIYSQKFINKKFKGNFKRMKLWIITQALESFNNAVDSYMDEYEKEICQKLNNSLKS